jgi:hypothetical protein
MQQVGSEATTALMDKEFECLHPDMHGVNLNTTAAREYVPDIGHSSNNDSMPYIAHFLSKPFQVE